MQLHIRIELGGEVHTLDTDDAGQAGAFLARYDKSGAMVTVQATAGDEEGEALLHAVSAAQPVLKREMH